MTKRNKTVQNDVDDDTIENCLEDPLEISYTNNKRIKFTLDGIDSKEDIRDWVSPSDLRNYMINDHIVDWLKFQRNNSKKFESTIEADEKKDVDEKEEKEITFQDFILNQGKVFERLIIEKIKEKVPVISISDDSLQVFEQINSKTCNEAIKQLFLGVPIIHAFPFLDEKNKTKGIIDLVVRSDYLRRIIEHFPMRDSEEFKRAPKLKGRYHYVVIDIKFSTIPLRSNATNILNSGNYPAYKAQLLIYNKAIGEIQGFTPDCAFILGRRWNYTSKGEKYNCSDSFNKLGIVDFRGSDLEYKEKTEQAIEWIRDVRKNGINWKINPPTNSKLYPNMCVDSGKWNTIKQGISQKLGEITMIWQVGINHRKKALEKGINSWRNKRCNSKILGIKGKRAVIIDKIIQINRGAELISPKIIKSNLFNWRNKVDDLFVDFETCIDVFDFENQKKTDFIFMIGVYYFDKPLSKWKYKSFTIQGFSDLEELQREEFKIMNSFANFISTFRIPKLWYWHADATIWQREQEKQYNNACETNSYENIEEIKKWDFNWCDMCKLFREEPIVIKDCFKFGLKEIAKALYSHGFIKTKIESNCSSGLNASISAWNAYKNKGDKDAILKDIELYNYFDTSVLFEIITLLRTKH